MVDIFPAPNPSLGGVSNGPLQTVQRYSSLVTRQSSLKSALYFSDVLTYSLCGLHIFQDFRDITLVCEDDRKSNITSHSVPGILPETDEQRPCFHIQPLYWLLILLLFGHQDEDHFTGSKEEEEESVNHEKKLEEERRLLEKERS